MTNLLNEILSILYGIDKDEVECENGWWENSIGADFGREKKEQIIKTINDYNSKRNDFGTSKNGSG